MNAELLSAGFTDEILKRMIDIWCVCQYGNSVEASVKSGYMYSKLNAQINPITNPSIINPSAKMQVSKKGIEKLNYFETGGKEYYEKRLSNFTWPGGSSGVTVGVGFDCGYYSRQEIIDTWTGYVNGNVIALMLEVQGLRGVQAKMRINEQMRRAYISYEVAVEVLLHKILPVEAVKTENTYPGVTALFPDAQAALLSLIYNRGTKLQDDPGETRRREMKAIAPLVIAKDYKGIAAQIILMKRLWEGQNMGGLLDRRDDEATLILHSDREYSPDEIISI